MHTLKDAVDRAINIFSPTRRDLYTLYFWTMKDSHLKSQLEIAINKVASLPFKVWKGDTENEDLKYLFKRPWFDSYLRISLEAELWGYTLMEFQDIVDGEFTDVKAFPRMHINPHFKEILPRPSDIRGIPYTDQMLQEFFLVEVGDRDDLGTLELLVKEVVWKNFARVDWSDFNERFGKPIIDIATDTDDDEEVRKRAAMASNFGSNLWLVRDVDDQVQIHEAKNIGGNAENFEKLIKMCNEEISKVINGQSGTSDEKSFVGSAEVGERILNDYTKARVRRISNHINYELIPFLVKYGYPLHDCTFEFVIEELKPIEDRKIEQGQPVNFDSLGRAMAKALFLERDRKPQPVQQPAMVAAVKLDAWLERFFNKTFSGIDRDMWQLSFERLLHACEEAGISFETGYKYEALASELQKNAAVFSAFKNHREQQELTRLLVDDQGKPRSWHEFKKAARPITQKYNQEWLMTEYKQAQASAQMAVKWEGFHENADLYPNLRYEAVMDSDTRPSHAELDGTVLPINDPFWATNYPPNDWGCRCTVVQTDATPTSKPAGIKPGDGFDMNPGMDRKLFSSSNSYQKETAASSATEVNQEADKLLRQYLGNED